MNDLLEKIIEHSENEFSILKNKLINEIKDDFDLNKFEYIKEKALSVITSLVEDKNYRDYSDLQTVIKIVNRLLKFLPLTEVGLSEEEWEVIDEEKNILRNKRCASVLKDNNGVYDVLYYVFVNKNGEFFYNEDSVKKVELPYMPLDESVVVSSGAEDGST